MHEAGMPTGGHGVTHLIWFGAPSPRVAVWSARRLGVSRFSKCGAPSYRVAVRSIGPSCVRCAGRTNSAYPGEDRA